MGARRKLQYDTPVVREAPTRPSLAGPQAAAVDSPVHERLALLHASFAEVEGPPPYSRAVRMAIMVGAPAALWGLVLISIGALARVAGA